ncbi:MAG: AmmeMemoRadiSam system protein B [Candidatus Falkowbacteria bacterium]
MNKAKLVLIPVFVVLVFLAAGFLFKTDSLSDDQIEISVPEIDYSDPIGALYTDTSLFLSPIKQTKTTTTPEFVSGLIVPHHLLAVDMIAEAFASISHYKYSKIVLLSPNHFDAGNFAVSVTEHNFSTVFGEVKTDVNISKKLKALSFVGEGDFFYREHGLQAELPFIKYYFPDSEVTAITFKATASQAELDDVVKVLKAELPKDSLIIQSTDFSHYLNPAQANEKDAESIKILEKNSPEGILELNQPDNIDSLAASYVQMSLQKDVFALSLNILGHKNSQDYTQEKVSSSTSYLTAVYAQLKKVVDSNQAELIFVGDTMLSRYIGSDMASRNDYDFPYAKIKSFLSEADLVFANLESPISNLGKSAGHLYSFRADLKNVLGLKNSGIDVLSVANNHTFDYGLEAFSDTLNNLKNAGLAYVGGGFNFKEAHQGVYKKINGIKISFLAYTDLLPKSQSATNDQAGFAYLDLNQMATDIKLAKEKSDLVIVSFHWGREYETKHNVQQEKVALAAIKAGASLVVGHHPHVVQDVSSYQGVTVAYSLGNFIFDQNFSPETKTGLALKVSIKDKKIEKVSPQVIYFNRYYQPYIVR